MQQATVRIQLAHLIHIVGEQRRQIGTLPQAADALPVFAEFAGLGRIKRISAGTGVCVDHPEGFVLLPEVAQQGDQYRVLEHIGVIPGVEGVAVAEHGVWVENGT